MIHAGPIHASLPAKQIQTHVHAAEVRVKTCTEDPASQTIVPINDGFAFRMKQAVADTSIAKGICEFPRIALTVMPAVTGAAAKDVQPGTQGAKMLGVDQCPGKAGKSDRPATAVTKHSVTSAKPDIQASTEAEVSVVSTSPQVFASVTAILLPCGSPETPTEVATLSTKHASPQGPRASSSAIVRAGVVDSGNIIEASSDAAAMTPAEAAPGKPPVQRVIPLLDAAATPTISVAGATPAPNPAVHGMPVPELKTSVVSATPSTLGSHIDKAATAMPPEVVDHRTLTATPNVLEVGIASGTHGWLKVRAEINAAGDVSASLAAASERAVESLHRELPSLSSYLQTELVGLTSLVVHRTAGTENPDMSFAGASAGGRDAQQERSAEQQSPETSLTFPRLQQSLRAAFSGSARVSFPGAFVPGHPYLPGGGSWLSVRV